MKRCKPKQTKALRSFLYRYPLLFFFPINICYSTDKFQISYCYTGLDYSTLVSLKEEHVVTDENGVRVIVIQRIKTQVVAQIPILPKAQAILDKYDEDRETAYLLPVMSNQKYNQYLKEIGTALGIEKKITTYLARHTFSTTVTYANGVSIGAISKMLGHTKLSTTEIYAKMMDRTVKDEMGKLAKVLEKKKKEHPQAHAC